MTKIKPQLPNNIPTRFDDITKEISKEIKKDRKTVQYESTCYNYFKQNAIKQNESNTYTLGSVIGNVLDTII